MNKALKRYGQNYLRDKNIILKIINELDPQPNDLILEIGPGKGALTTELLKKDLDLTVIELDKNNCEYLRINFPELKIIQADFLDVDLKIISKNKKIKLIGNIPYNITTPIVYKILSSAQQLETAVLMVQKEAAQRFSAKPGGKEYAGVNILINYFTEPEICFFVGRNNFYPKPNVDSAVVKFNFKNFERAVSDKLFIEVVKAAYQNRRKTLKNSLSNSILNTYNFSDCGVDLTRRADQLEISDFIKLAEYVKEKNGQ